jgi:hypothetical protein
MKSKRRWTWNRFGFVSLPANSNANSPYVHVSTLLREEILLLWHVCMLMHARYVRVCLYTCIYFYDWVCIHVYKYNKSGRMYLCTYICVCILYIYIHTYIHTYTEWCHTRKESYPYSHTRAKRKCNSLCAFAAVGNTCYMNAIVSVMVGMKAMVSVSASHSILIFTHTHTHTHTHMLCKKTNKKLFALAQKRIFCKYTVTAQLFDNTILGVCRICARLQNL